MLEIPKRVRFQGHFDVLNLLKMQYGTLRTMNLLQVTSIIQSSDHGARGIETIMFNTDDLQEYVFKSEAYNVLKDKKIKEIKVWVDET